MDDKVFNSLCLCSNCQAKLLRWMKVNDAMRDLRSHLPVMQNALPPPNFIADFRDDDWVPVPTYTIRSGDDSLSTVRQELRDHFCSPDPVIAGLTLNRNLIDDDEKTLQVLKQLNSEAQDKTAKSYSLSWNPFS